MQLALDRRVDEVIAKFNKSEDILAGGLLTFAIFFVCALVNLLLVGPTLFVITIVLGFVICLPIVLTGLVKIDRLRKLLDPKQKHVPELEEAHDAPALPEGTSVTEHTTARLNERGQATLPNLRDS